MKCLKNETFRYLIAGGVTVVVNIFSYALLSQMMPQMIANVLAFVCATVFAFWSNSFFVFRVSCTVKRFFEFVAMRISTMVIDSVGMCLFLELSWNDLFSKVIINLIVIILNYLLSKFFVFSGKIT